MDPIPELNLLIFTRGNVPLSPSAKALMVHLKRQPNALHGALIGRPAAGALLFYGLAKQTVFRASMNNRGPIMMMRPKLLQNFLDATFVVADRFVTDHHSKLSVSRIWAALQTHSEISEGAGTGLPVCSQLGDATKPSLFQDPELCRLIDAFVALEPALSWRVPDGSRLHASTNFEHSHANTVIVGPSGIERRDDLLIGVSLLASNVRYPDHSHPPEETYLVLSDGSFRQKNGAWFTPGIGGTFYNSPGIVHAMRSGDSPLLAVWLLWAG
ncbi:dimethylsulfonioproprionate lyase family protein [Pseudorhodobacter ferrugineus]|uniref:dimethylsulfonioproprionate lyase family protein n=1 Tax=Pseudorhodobacter ferrugineus TaxID=77008 RepID=UPI001B7FA5B7|nr:dimethylsulfonioproprionate lyase family protein [Pseudorhodobacter ferrugineus]